MALLQIMIVAGEASGDQLMADLVAEIRRRLPEARFFGMGGPLCAAQNAELVYGAREVSVMGITEVIPKLPRMLKVLRGLARAASHRRPACAILADIPDFNLRLALKLKRMGIPVVYYVSPMIWAWRTGRIEAIAERVDEMICILPFEEAIYRRAGVRVKYVGNPVLDQVPPAADPAHFRAQLGLDERRPTLALLPGSRPSEIRRILPAMVGAARELARDRSDLQVVVPVAPSIPRADIASAFSGSGQEPSLVSGKAADVVGASDAAVVASGTAVLEAALMERPFIVVYRVAPVSYLVGRMMLKVKYVSLVNLLLGRRVVPELIQGAMSPETIAGEVRRLWNPGRDRDEMLSSLREVREKLGRRGAAARAADEVVALIRG
jgi:lipid-A-disaccharide synthase